MAVVEVPIFPTIPDASIAVNFARLREKSGILLDWFLCRTFSPWIGDLLAPGALIFDIGAHQGSKTSRFLSRGCKIVMVEPQSQMLKILKRKFRANNNVLIEPCAAGERSGQEEFFTAIDTPGISTLSRKWMNGRFRTTGRWNEGKKVRVKTIDELIHKYGKPDWVKIDVEGYEKKVLAGLSEKVGIISFEYSEENLVTACQCVKKLQALGYRDFTFTDRGKDRFAGTWASWPKILRMIKKNQKSGGAWGDIYGR